MQDEFGTHTDNAALSALIAAEISACGPVPFRRFMELALYQPVHGYYAAPDERIGPRGDYLTSPEISPLFGATAGRQVAEVWRLLGEPDPFTVVEPGPGNGALAADLLRWAARAEPRLRRALRYVLVERFDQQRLRQRRQLDAEPGVSWSAALPAGITGCIISNELLDALPVHLVRRHADRLEEAYVERQAGGFRLVWQAPSTVAIPAYFAALGLMPAPDAVAEVNLEAPAWLAAAAATLAAGALLTLDYGYPARRLYAPWRRQGTLMTFYRHTPGDDPLQRVGRQDITAHVDFTSVARAGLDAGLELSGFTTQAGFLTALGLHEALSIPPGEELFARRRAVDALTEASGLGRVRVLALTRGLGGVTLRGFAGAPAAAAALFGEEEEG